MTTSYTLHYGGDTFLLPTPDVADEFMSALKLAAKGTGMIMTLEYIRKDGGLTRHHFLLAPGVPAYLTVSDTSSSIEEPSPVPAVGAGEPQTGGAT